MPKFWGLDVTTAAHSLTLDVYRETARFPSHEQFGITSQIRRAAISIGANIAEGCGRGGDRELRRFLRIALGSANELEYLLRVAIDLGYLQRQDLHDAAVSVSKRINAFRLKVTRDLERASKTRPKKSRSSRLE